MKVKLYKVHNLTENRWYTFKDFDKMQKFLDRPINYKIDLKVHVIYEEDKKFQQLKLNLD